MVGGAVGMDMFSSSERENHNMHNYNRLETTKEPRIQHVKTTQAQATLNNVFSVIWYFMPL